MLLDECKYVVKERIMPEYITDDTENSCDDSNREDLISLIERILMKKCLVKKVVLNK